MASVSYDYRCTVLDWLDGDTVRLEVDLGFNVFHRIDARLYGINAPEVHSRDAAEKKRGGAARDYCVGLAPRGSLVTVRSHKDGAEKFGRWLAEIVLADGRVVNDLLVGGGYALPWDGQGKRPI